MSCFTARAIWLASLLAAAGSLFAQDGPATASKSGAPQRRGARGAESTREFLGLGPAPDTAAAAKGEPLYKQNCASCHGEKARGAQGPNLVRSVLVLHDEKGEEIGPVVKNGRPQAGMPGFPNLSAQDLYDISQYLHLQVELTANRGTYRSTYSSLLSQTTGDPNKGEAFFNGAGRCNQCHSVTGDLAGVGKRFPQAAMMQARLLWPASQGPEKATVTLPGGQKVDATIKTLNDFDVSFYDASGEYHYYPRSQVAVQVEDPLKGHRALLPRYSDADIHDLAAYLETLK
jgi:cytochrome c oxidase cbb3-type subunit 3